MKKNKNEEESVEEDLEEETEVEEEKEEPKESEEETEESEEVEEEKEQKKTWKIKCSECGKDADVPFQPDGNRPVYCRDCYQKHKPPRSF